MSAFAVGALSGALVVGQSSGGTQSNAEPSNWGRWGKDDQLGALNLITNKKRKEAAALVKDGVSVSLSNTFNYKKEADNASPVELLVAKNASGGVINANGSISDRMLIPYHGTMVTHLDDLAHIVEQNKMYDGYPAAEIFSEEGAAKGDVINVKNGIFTRGILFDIPRLKGVAYIEPGTGVTPQDLEAWEKKAGIKVSAGDAIFVRTGRWARRAISGPWEIGKLQAGLDPSCVPWLKQRGVVLVGGDYYNEMFPGKAGRDPIHIGAINHLGVRLIDNAHLEAASELAAARQRWEFLLVVVPLAVPHATGSPVNPIATF